ncbi:MAG: heavy-metal-associated domain-containing protein [Candidatus Micrarchaeota archaeon]
MKKAKLLIKSIHCASCKMLIEEEVADLGAKANVDIAKKTAELEFDEKKVKLSDLRDALREMGYESEVIA